MSPRSRAGLTAGVATAALGYLALLISKVYGVAVFVAAPFLCGFAAIMLASRVERRRLRDDLLLAAKASILSYALAAASGVEGFVCLLLFLPLAIPMALLGGWVGHRIAANRKAIALALLPPLIGTGEMALRREPPVIPVTTSVEIDAPPQAVWNAVISTREMPPPDELLFRAGIAFPVRAHTEGSGVGAVRKCQFSSGPFLEPITVWDEPRRLAFRVAAQPPLMKEMSPWDIEPPHLEGHFTAHRGQFELVPLAGNRTLLKGTTWYSHRIWPALYWNIWSAHILHTVHNRVFAYIRRQAEAGGH